MTAKEVYAAIANCRPSDLYWPEAQWIIFQALDAAGHRELADDALRDATQWIERTARLHVSPFFKDSFLHRNAVNRAVLSGARRRFPA